MLFFFLFGSLHTFFVHRNVTQTSTYYFLGNQRSHFKLKFVKHYKSHYKIILIICVIHSFIDSVHSVINLFDISFTHWPRVPSWTQHKPVPRDTSVISTHSCSHPFWMIQTSSEGTYIKRQLHKNQQWCERISLYYVVFYFTRSQKTHPPNIQHEFRLSEPAESVLYLINK